MSTPQIPPDKMRAADADRMKVADQLSAAFADGRLSHDELEERVNAAMQAKTLGELEPLTYDLPGVGQRPAVNAQDDSADLPVVQRRDAAAATVIGLFGGGTRQGEWHCPERVNVAAVFGGVDLDFTEATFEKSTIEVRTLCMFGGMDAKVPEGVNVRNEMISIFGGSDVKDVVGHPDGPTIVFKGLNLFGGTDVKGPGRARAEARRAARNQRRQERRGL